MSCFTVVFYIGLLFSEKKVIWERGGVEELNRVEGGATVVGMCYMRNKLLFNKYFFKKSPRI